MKTTAVRLYGKRDLRLETYELPPLKDGELLVKIISDSLCMSSYKAAELGGTHKRVPDNVHENPVVIGHECCGEIIEVGGGLEKEFERGMRFSIQPAMNDTYDALGYSYPFIGGNMTYGVIPSCYVESGCVLKYEGDSFFAGSLAEPLSCVIGAAHANYHTIKGSYRHEAEIVKGGKTAILAGAGPMGLAMIDYLIHREHRPSVLVVTDINAERLERAARILSPEMAACEGVKLEYLNTGNEADPAKRLTQASGGVGFDDVFVFAPVPAVIEQGDAVLAYDGCLNFFAGPVDSKLSAKVNFYNVHYNAAHFAGTSGGNTEDMREALDMAAAGRLNPALLVTHIGGLDAAARATLELPNIPGGKKLIYNHINMPLAAISEFAEKGKTDPLFKQLHEICDSNSGLWCAEAEKVLLDELSKG